jgi:hypothetical protein
VGRVDSLLAIYGVEYTDGQLVLRGLVTTIGLAYFVECSGVEMPIAHAPGYKGRQCVAVGSFYAWARDDLKRGQDTRALMREVIALQYYTGGEPPTIEFTKLTDTDDSLWKP